MAKNDAFFLLAAATEELIQLECAGRRGLARQKRWLARFHTIAHKSRFKEKLAQARRHQFLLRFDNKASLKGIIDTVRDLANDVTERGDRRKASPLGLIPSELNQLKLWASDVESLLCEFKPSENHIDDPLFQIVERLQFLQDSHECLAEAAIDARALLGRWDREGVFDLDTYSDDDGEKINAKNEHRNKISEIPFPARANDTLRFLAQSNVYQSVRQRAAAGIIKRNVLTWVRSKAFLCDRVAELEIFGRTTEQLLKELRLTKAPRTNASVTNSLALTRCDPKSRYSNCVAFNDLRQYSKYMALFPVDQALRTVEEVSRRRYLFHSRCAMKIQAVWRRVREAVQMRQLHRALEDLRLQRDKEAQIRREAIKEAKRQKKFEAGKLKTRKGLKRSSSARSSMLSPANSKITSASTDDKSKERATAQTTQTSASTTNMKREPSVPPLESSFHRDSTRSSTASAAGEKVISPLSTSRSRQRFSRCGYTGNNECDDEPTDVEVAWKSFMDAVVTDTITPAVQTNREVPLALEDLPVQDSTHSMPLPPMNDTWESWSDDEKEVIMIKEVETGGQFKRLSTLMQPRSPSPSFPPQIKVKDSVKKSDPSEAAICISLDTELATPQSNHNRAQSDLSVPDERPPSSLSFDATQQNHAGPTIGAGQLSLFAPFVDTDKKPKISVAPKRKHLYELDFSKNERRDASFVHVADVLDMLHETELLQDQKNHNPVEKAQMPTVGVSTRQTTIAKLRGVVGDKEQHTQAHSSRKFKNQEVDRSNDPFLSSSQAPSYLPGHFSYYTDGSGLNREGILRTGLMVSPPLSVLPEEEIRSAIDSKGKETKTWHRSSITVLRQFPVMPHPPVDRFRRHHLRRIKAQGSTTSSSSQDQIQSIALPAKKALERFQKQNEIPLLLRRTQIGFRREFERPTNLSGYKTETDLNSLREPNGQMWKRGQELPELALAQIRDRVKVTPKHHDKAILAGRAPPRLARTDEKSIASATSSIRPDMQLKTILLVGTEAEEGSNNGPVEANTVDCCPVNASSCGELEVTESGECNEESVDRIQFITNSDLSEEFQRLHLQSRERELSRHRSLLAQLQSNENIVTTKTLRCTDAGGQQLTHNQNQSRQVRERSRAELAGEASDALIAKEITTSVWHHGMGNKSPNVYRRVRVKTRDVKRIPLAKLFDDVDDQDGDKDEKVSEKKEMEERDSLNRTPRERDAAFQELLSQYLGLLQCTPAELMSLSKRPAG